MKIGFVLLMVFCLGYLATPLAWAGSLPSGKNGDLVKRVAGTYKVVSIHKKGDGFIVEFASEAKTGTYDKLLFESDYIHSGVREGSVMRISADLLSESSGVAEIAQLVLFYQTKDSHVPIWMLSKKAVLKRLKGANYLEMHAPTSDYLVL